MKAKVKGGDLQRDDGGISIVVGPYERNRDRCGVVFDTSNQSGYLTTQDSKVFLLQGDEFGLSVSSW